MRSLQDLPIEPLRRVVEYLDIHSRIKFSQAYGGVYRLSLAESSFWRNSKISNVLNPCGDCAPEGRLRIRIATLALNHVFDRQISRIKHTVEIPQLDQNSVYFVPSGTRWFFQYTNTPHARIVVHDTVTGELIGQQDFISPIHAVAGGQISPNKVLLLLRHETGAPIICTAEFNAKEKERFSVRFLVTKITLEAPPVPPILFVQDGWVITANTALGYIAKWHEDKLSPVYYFEPTNNYNIMGVCVAESLLIVHEGRWDEGNPHRTQVSVFNLSMITDGFNDHHDRGSAQAARRLSPTNPRPFVLPKGLEELARKSPATYCIEGNGDECSTLTFIVKTPFGLCNTRSAETWRYQPFRYGIQVHKGPVPGEESFKYIPHTDMEFMESDLRQKLKNCVITLSSSGRRALWFDKNRDTRIQSDNQGSPESKSGRVYFGSGGDSSTIRADWQSPVFFDDTLGMLVLPDTPEYVSVHWFLPRDLLVSKEVGKKPTHH